MTRGISLAWETIALAILVVIVILVLSLIFREHIIRLLQLDGPCGQGSYGEYACFEEHQDDAFHCIRSTHLCAEGYCCRVES